jgi:serine/threonine protein phosphatase PrpC
LIYLQKRKVNSLNKKNSKINKSAVSHKNTLIKTKVKKFVKKLTRNSTKEILTKTNSEFKSKFNFTNTINLKSNNLIKDNKIGFYTRSSKILPSFKFDLSPKKKKKIDKNNCLLLKKSTKKKELQKEKVRLTIPPSKEKKIKNKNDEINMKENINKNKKENSKENIRINISTNSNNIIRSKILGNEDKENNGDINSIFNKTHLLSKKIEILKTEKINIKHLNNISLDKTIKSVRSFKDLLLNTENKNTIKSHHEISQAGSDEYGRKKINQDSYLFLEAVNGLKDFNIFGVFDGHGSEGHLISQFVTRYIQLEFKRNKSIGKIKDVNVIYDKIKSNNFQMLKDIFINADNILREQEIESRNSGSTCVIVIHLGEHIICANAGDSRAILIYDKKHNNNYKVFPLSVDSKPELKEEKDRIYRAGGIVEKVTNQYGQEIGPYRVWGKSKEFPGLAMSRSIGDFSGKNLGIIPDPQIIEANFEINVNYIVICSDGVWEFLNNEDVMKIGNKFYKENNPRGFCKEVVDYATKCWKKEDFVIDDITILVVFF